MYRVYNIPSSSWIKLLSTAPVVSKLFVLLTNKVGLLVADVTGYNGIGRSIGAFVGRIGGRIGGCPLVSLPPVLLQRSRPLQFLSHNKYDISDENEKNFTQYLHGGQRIAAFVCRTTNPWYEQTFKAQRLPQFVKIKQQLRTITEVLTFSRITLRRRACGQSRIIVSICEFHRGLLRLLLLSFDRRLCGRGSLSQ